MRFSFTALALVALGLRVNADKYANFFTDENCNEDGSIGFSLDNPGCFNQASMKSVYIPNNPIDWNQHYALVISKDGKDCPCQNDCYEFQATGFCHKLDGEGQSYRFIGGGCDPNNC
ncbi:uncharacterized protein I303_107570 [Kwoniella dejecticola CBS 10117]|uniref:Uncharacterized protein n=1 Tax=Kwoniella dejecticola CBS 10117 TaxID=1296121 RepID=A0A1A5ZV38_9TREE|nr:uncharacterized protein I303_07580 [Kwoniella dejecticola CBS 10117]OBR81670.1 hypothetical protein I303_07580 [Kwoniella dejecticola CBS 10117]